MAYRNIWAVQDQRRDVLLEFKAGKMTFTPTTKLVVADKRKGIIQIKQNPEDNLLRFIWKDRITGAEELNLIIFPGEASFRRVEESKARVYVLEWKDLDKKLFFWIQEIKEDKDKENCARLNLLIDEQPQTRHNNNSSSLGMNQGHHLRQLLQAGGFGGMDTSQLVHILGGERPHRLSGSTGPLSPNRRSSSTGTLPGGSSGSANEPPSPAATTASPANGDAPTMVSNSPISTRISLQNILDELLLTQIPTEEKKEEDNEENKETKDDNTQMKEDKSQESEKKPH